MSFRTLLTSHPDVFMSTLKEDKNPLSESTALELDRQDPLSYTRDWFNIGESKLTAFAGHSLGHGFIPAHQAMAKIHKLQSDQLHEAHFTGNDVGSNFFECNIQKEALASAQKFLGFAHLDEFIYSPKGLSDLLSEVVHLFYNPVTLENWQQGKTKIAMLKTEFISDRSIVNSVLKSAIQTADGFHVFKGHKPKSSDLTVLFKPNDDGIYDTQQIIQAIIDNQDTLKMICLPDIVFSTGQRLELEKIFAAVTDVIRKHDIQVILDLAHGVGNCPIDLKSLPVAAAVGCAYKHLSGTAGEGFGVYMRRFDPAKHIPIQGWNALQKELAFANINDFDKYQAEAKEHKAYASAIDIRKSNPCPTGVIHSEVYMMKFAKIGWDIVKNKSECLTRYLIEQLKRQLGEKNIKFITPLDPKQRGATICFKINEKIDAAEISEQLKKAGFEIDVRPPNVFRVTAHYGYTRFIDVYRFTTTLKNILENNLKHRQHFLASKLILSQHSLFAPEKEAAIQPPPAVAVAFQK